MVELRAKERALIWQVRGDRPITLVETAVRTVEGAHTIVLLYLRNILNTNIESLYSGIVQT